MSKEYDAAQALSFHPVLPWQPAAEGVHQENGENWLSLYFPNAKQATLVFAEKEYAGQRQKNGLWKWKLPFDSAINYVQLVVDGSEILSPALPIGYGYSRPYNFVTLDVEGEDYYGLQNVPHGSVRREYFYSGVTGEWESCMVYTPPEYEKTAETYPVLYLQHGHGENEIGWTSAGRVNFILDNLLAENKAAPFLVVMCNGMVQKVQKDGKRKVDFTLLEPQLLWDVIPFIENKFRVKKEKTGRAMAGLSMGSLQTCITVFRHPEMFAYAGLFSGFMTDFIQGSELDMIQRPAGKNEHLRILDDRQAFSQAFRVFFRAMGTEDVFMEHFLRDDALCREKGISHIRKTYEGAHDWNVWRRCIYDFSQLIFRPCDETEAARKRNLQ